MLESEEERHTESSPELPDEAPGTSQTLSSTSGSDAERGDGLRGQEETASLVKEHGDQEKESHNSLSQPDPSSSSKNVTCQPKARSVPCHSTESCSLDCNSTRQNGTRPTRDRPAAGSSPGSASHKGPPRKLQSNPSLTSQGSKRSRGSSKSTSSQIPSKAQDDCCVHCILACLFCEFLTLCNIMLDCATCGSCSSEESCFCCCCGSDECGDCDLPCDMDCGIIDACCESADCLEICMECCGLCFSS
ncbi:myoD family inhibitor [Brienomyrus brachyistius]|uniref:myoD family inhibitor n=1 Tax=Brienomyrus brachyistius TaxID=42636 RepID=UPI0020B3E259|nr:myoD family inhibitor [Brienomyrus brachyistius]XP_048879764.1 myoD family inhibitor [Brienomyrus brachyistius]